MFAFTATSGLSIIFRAIRLPMEKVYSLSLSWEYKLEEIIYFSPYFSEVSAFSLIKEAWRWISNVFSLISILYQPWSSEWVFTTQMAVSCFSVFAFEYFLLKYTPLLFHLPNPIHYLNLNFLRLPNMFPFTGWLMPSPEIANDPCKVPLVHLPLYLTFL